MSTYKRFQLIFEDCVPLNCNILRKQEPLYRQRMLRDLSISFWYICRRGHNTLLCGTLAAMGAWVLKLIRHNKSGIVFHGYTTQVFGRIVWANIDYLCEKKPSVQTLSNAWLTSRYMERQCFFSSKAFLIVPDTRCTCSIVVCLFLNPNWCFGMMSNLLVIFENVCRSEMGR